MPTTPYQARAPPFSMFAQPKITKTEERKLDIYKLYKLPEPGSNSEKIEISDEVALVITSSERKLRHFTYDLKREKAVRVGGDIVILPSREDSLNRLVSIGYDFASEEKSIEDVVINSIMTDQLRSALTKLSDKERKLITDIYYHGYSQHKIAERLGISQPAVKKQCDRAVAHLRKIMRI